MLIRWIGGLISRFFPEVFIVFHGLPKLRTIRLTFFCVRTNSLEYATLAKNCDAGWLAVFWLHRGRQAQDNRAGYKSSGPTEAGKHRTIEQAIKVAGPQRQASTGQ